MFLDKLIIEMGQTEREKGMMSLTVAFRNLELHYKRDIDLQILSWACAE